MGVGATKGQRVLDWAGNQDELAQLAQKQLFFVGGAPRSGTTWLQQMLDSHPEVCCRGEGLFLNHFAVPLERLMNQRAAVIEGKNRSIFGHTGGYPLAPPEDCEFLVGSAIMLGFRQQAAAKPSNAIGEKTPENVFFFPRLKRLFPRGKFIAIARDPRDVLSSAWHFFAKNGAGVDEAAAKRNFIVTALPSLADGARAMVEFQQRHPADCAVVTYEQLRIDPATELARLFRLLGVSDAAEVVADCIARTSFAKLSGGRRPGEERDGSFFRKGVVGDWRETFSADQGKLVIDQLGWMFPRYGWTI